jgi:hypothetical protein
MRMLTISFTLDAHLQRILQDTACSTSMSSTVNQQQQQERVWPFTTDTLTMCRALGIAPIELKQGKNLLIHMYLLPSCILVCNQ